MLTTLSEVCIGGASYDSEVTGATAISDVRERVNTACNHVRYHPHPLLKDWNQNWLCIGSHHPLATFRPLCSRRSRPRFRPRRLPRCCPCWRRRSYSGAPEDADRAKLDGRSEVLLLHHGSPRGDGVWTNSHVLTRTRSMTRTRGPDTSTEKKTPRLSK